MSMTTTWMINELDYAGPEHLDPAFVEGYDRKQGYLPDIDEELAALTRHGLSADSVLVDFGAGSGRVPLAAAKVCRRVVAADVSPAMNAYLRDRAKEAGADNLEVVQAGFLTYEHQGEAPDVVYTRNALHQLPDFFKALALTRIAQLLRPGGILRLHDLVYDFEPSEADDRFAAWFAGASDDPAVGYTAEDYAEHIRTEYSTFRWLLEPMLERAGFEILESSYFRSAFGTYTCRLRA
ncbi:class I SAM-dependent methyltransferase [Streptomyces boninensis]|uniref:class I SAM-dependent methyltransferase n=1 Tax=Streptomyces boninensis TaxID=2039455 RepID=UPI003B210ECA